MFELAHLLRERREQITESFVDDVRRAVALPSGVSQHALIDHVPVFLEHVANELERGGAGAPHECVTHAAREHGRQRWVLGYDLESLIREYDVLRSCISSAAKRAGLRPSLDEFDVLAQCMGHGVREAVAEYTAYRDEELAAKSQKLAFLAEAGEVLSSSLDQTSTLRHLTRLLVPKMADWCAVHVEGLDVTEMPIAHVDPAKVALVRTIFQRHPLPSDSPLGYQQVLRTGEPQLMTAVEPSLLEAAARGPEHLALLRELGSCSWMVVPLRVQGHVFGALSFAYSDSRRQYDASDLPLAEEVARRAAAAIDNARLYQLSQRERSRVEAATRAKDEFVAVVSHELRTPLNAILGWIRLVRAGSLTPAKQAYAFEVIERNAEAQNRLVADLLDISRILTGKVRITPSQVDLGTIVELVVEGISPAAEAKRIRIERDIDRGSALLRADGDRLQQVVWNLLGNAVKFTPKGGRVRVCVQRSESDLELIVSDSGPGIPPAFLDHVFDSFRQWDSSATRAHGGLGIGLSIAKHIVELHGGEIRAESAGQGQGATFVVRLPVSPLVSTTLGVSRVPATKPPPLNEPAPTCPPGLEVLVVDDERDARELVAYLLETSGMTVRLAGNAAEALGLLESYRPDVVISDIGMPEQDGYALIRSIRMLTDEDKKRVPAIALTAFARNEDRTRALVAGFNRHMPKPVEPSALVAAVLELAGEPSRAGQH